MIKHVKNTPVFFLLSIILALIYWRTLAYPFQFDDFNVIVNRTDVHGLHAWWQSMPGMRPLLKLSYALNWQFDTQPNYFRLFNLCCHLGSSFLVYLLAKALLPFFNVQENHALIAVLTAIMFALHPAHSEVVVYISSRSSGLMALLSLASMLVYLNWLTQTPQQMSRLYLSGLLWFAAVLVKEVALVVPMLAAWLTYFVAPQKLSHLKQLSLKQKLLLLACLLIPLLLVISIPQYARLFTKLINPQLSQLANQPFAHVHYLLNTLWGVGLNIDYGALQPAQWLKVVSGLAWVVAVYLCWAKRKNWPLFSFAVGWWLICLLPTNSIINRPDLINDRQIYMASISVLLLLSVGLVHLQHFLPKMLGMLLLCVPIIYFGMGTVERSADYQSEISLWQASLIQNHFNARAWNNLGYAYQLAGEAKKAKDCYENALMIDPNHSKALRNLPLVNGSL
ncbi:MAG TPA: tetratricopeptide repeat protein [Methylotenera sp.]|nr:tetratricopeptide repeat protein [Methylotenera sp.]HPH06370.1 tetratricopeptide repeat protein [Methylotenera sp.]HPN00811.1 tetratricopeptide repeat protein [Methylotenera sp.]